MRLLVVVFVLFLLPLYSSQFCLSCLFGNWQATAVIGRLLCNGEPAKDDVEVKLYDEEILSIDMSHPNATDAMDGTVMDQLGENTPQPLEDWDQLGGRIASLAVNAGRRCEPTEASRASSRLSSPESSRGSVNGESPSTCSDPSIRYGRNPADAYHTRRHLLRLLDKPICRKG